MRGRRVIPVSLYRARVVGQGEPFTDEHLAHIPPIYGHVGEGSDLAAAPLPFRLLHHALHRCLSLRPCVFIVSEVSHL